MYGNVTGVTDRRLPWCLPLRTYLPSQLHAGFGLVCGQPVSITQLFEFLATCGHWNYFILFNHVFTWESNIKLLSEGRGGWSWSFIFAQYFFFMVCKALRTSSFFRWKILLNNVVPYRRAYRFPRTAMGDEIQIVICSGLKIKARMVQLSRRSP